MKYLTLRGVALLLIVLLGAFANARADAASARAWLDRTEVQLGETLTLNVELEGSASSAAPDFSALQKDFDSLGTSSNTSVSIINGQSSSKVLWAVGLQPKHEGTLAIPALSVGGASTQPLSVTVGPAAPGGVAGAGKGGSEVMLELTAEPHTPYVQQQIRATVKLYYAVSLTEGNLEDPHLDGLVVKKLGQDKNYQGTVNGRTYNIVERHYALTAENSGALSIPAVNFRGRAQDLNDPNSFFNRGRLVGAHSDPLTLEVRPRPADSGNGPWLPATTLTLSADGIDAATHPRVGDPLTLNLHLKAQGLGFEQLPELNLASLDGAEVYPDKSATRTRDDGNWIYGERDRKFAIVPTRAGTLTLPAVEVRWWDSEHDRAATATLPAQQIEVLPAAGAAAAAGSPAAAGSDHVPGNAAASDDSVALAALGARLQRWQWLAAASLLLWLVSAMAAVWWWRQHAAPRRVPAVAAVPAIDDSRPRRTLREACARNDLDAAAHALLAWGRLHQPSLRNLGELAPLLADPQQRELLLLLGRARFGDGDGNGLAVRIAAAFAGGIVFAAPAARPSTAAALPPLYPDAA